MLSSLHLGNFKAFDRTQKVPIKPITLIFGPNSGGKSSLIHGLLLAHHVFTKGESNVHSTSIGGDAVDLGGFKQFVHKREYERQVELGIEIDSSKLTKMMKELLGDAKQITFITTFGLLKSPEGIWTDVSIISSYEIKIDGKTLLVIKNVPGEKLQLEEFYYRHKAIRIVLDTMFLSGTTSSLREEDYNIIDEIKVELFRSIRIECKDQLPKVITSLDDNRIIPISNDKRKQEIINALYLFLPQALDNFISEITGSILYLIESLNYLGPLRSYPQRHMIFEKPYDPNWYSGGAYAWDIIRKNSEVRTKINNWLNSEKRLQTPYRLIVREFVSQSFSDDFEDGIQPVNDDGLSELLLIDSRTKTIVSHRDVGVGISQILPVLVSSYASSNQVICIEQPEIHLHPALQAELGDVFIESALGKNQNKFLLETHSEHLILRIMRRMRETAQGRLPEGMHPVYPSDVSVIYIQPKDSSSIVKVIELDEEGQLIDPWPGGFFEEGFWERFS
jgi:hypothetical protein